MFFLQFKPNCLLWDKRLVRVGLILLHACMYVTDKSVGDIGETGDMYKWYQLRITQQDFEK